MKQLMLGFLAFILCGCGAETATTAATAAAIKKQEIVEGQKMQDDMKARVERSMSQTQQRTEKDTER
jgi:NifU-like protein involved in Fe-S cluster formation